MPILDHPVNGTVKAARQPTLIRTIKALRDDAVTLARQEVALAKREIAGKITSLGKHAAYLGLGGAVGLFGLFFVLLALNNLIFAGLARAGFSSGIAAWLAPALTGMGILGLALALFFMGLRGMRQAAPIPDRTLETLRDDKEWMKGKFT